MIFTSAFTDSITEDWGGRPFIDLKLGWKFALQTYPEVMKNLHLFPDLI